MDDLGKKLMKRDLYDFLGISETATDQEIKKAFRQKALSCHPDKNPDDINAANLFREVTKSCEILLDAQARKSYDKILKARKGVRSVDPKLEKFRRDLEEKETKWNDSRQSKEDEAKLAEQIERLIRRQGCEQLEKENEALRQEILKQSQPRSQETRVKVSWKNKDIDISKVKGLFERFGCVTDFVCKGSSALLVYSDSMSAVEATQSPLISGFTVTLLDPLPSSMPKRKKLSSDYEDSVLEKMKRKASQQKSKDNS